MPPLMRGRIPPGIVEGLKQDPAHLVDWVHGSDQSVEKSETSSMYFTLTRQRLVISEIVEYHKYHQCLVP